MSNNFDIMQDLLYMQELQPDDGFEIDFAVGTTFSLSMDGLISVPLALSNMGDPKSLTDQTAMYLMEGIRRASDKFVLFCNKGSILFPNNCQPIYSLLENSVIEVANSLSPLANFHPKMWLIRQKPIARSGESMIKLIVMSRNLTFSNDLDTAIVIKGKISKEWSIKEKNKGKNKPLHDFLIELSKKYVQDDDRKEKIINLAKDLLRVDNFDFERPLSSNVYEIYPYLSCNSSTSTNFNNYSLIDRLKGRRILIISPFIDNDPSSGILKTLIDESSDAYLVTRDNNITQEVLDMFKEVYTPHISLTDDDEQYNVNLHSKVYVVENVNESLYIYLGSANATNSAFFRNSELTIGMRVNNLGFEALMKELVLKDGLYTRVTEPISNYIDEKQKRQVEADMEHVLRWVISRLDKATVVKKSRCDYYTVKLRIKESDANMFQINSCINNYVIKIRPLQCNNEWKSFLSNPLQWNLQLQELSMFYVIEVIYDQRNKTLRRICKVNTEGLEGHAEQRNDKIVSSIVKSDNIIEYIEMILSDFPEDTLETWNRRKQNIIDKHLSGISLWKNASIYELLLKASYDSPDKMNNLKDLLHKLPDDEFDDDMKKLFKAFGITLKSKKK